MSFSSPSDPKLATQSQTRGGKKPPWTASALAVEAKELTHAVRSILELDCKYKWYVFSFVKLSKLQLFLMSLCLTLMLLSDPWPTLSCKNLSYGTSNLCWTVLDEMLSFIIERWMHNIICLQKSITDSGNIFGLMYGLISNVTFWLWFTLRATLSLLI